MKVHQIRTESPYKRQKLKIRLSKLNDDSDLATSRLQSEEGDNKTVSYLNKTHERDY